MPATNAAAADVQTYDLIDKFTKHSGGVAKSTAAYRERFYSLFGAMFGATAAESIRPIDVLVWANGMPTWNNSTRALAIRSIVSAFNWGVRVGLISKNPLTNVDLPEAEKGRAWTLKEFDDAIGACDDQRFEWFMKFMRETGARPGEVSMLEWTTIFDDRAIINTGHKTWRKIKRPRVIPLTPAAKAVLAEINRPLSPWIPPQVFLTRRGAAWDRSKLSLKMTEVREAANLPDDCVLHGIRHLFATDFIKRGGSIAVLSKILGHASIQTTINVYIHLADDDVELMLAAMKGLSK